MQGHITKKDAVRELTRSSMLWNMGSDLCAQTAISESCVKWERRSNSFSLLLCRKPLQIFNKKPSRYISVGISVNTSLVHGMCPASVSKSRDLLSFMIYHTVALLPLSFSEKGEG